MHFLSFLDLVFLTTATAFPTGSTLSAISAGPSNSPYLYQEFPNVSNPEIHRNVMMSHPPELILTSDKVNEYVETHMATTYTIYVSDTESWIIHEPESPTNKLAARQRKCVAGQGDPSSTNVKILSTQVYLSPYQTTGECIDNSEDPGDSNKAIGYSYTVQYTSSFTAEVNLADVFSASFSFQVSTQYSNSSTITCDVPGNSQARVWARNKIGWASVAVTQCDCGGYCQPVQNGWAALPSSEAQDLEIRCLAALEGQPIDCRG